MGKRFGFCLLSLCVLFILAGGMFVLATNEGVQESNFVSVEATGQMATSPDITWTVYYDDRQNIRQIVFSGEGPINDMTEAKWNAELCKSYCASATSMVIDDGITEIGSYFGSYCTLSGGVYIGKDVIRIGEGAFYRSLSGQSVTIPGNVKVIDNNAVSSCRELVLEEGVEFVCNVSATERIYLPSTVKVIVGSFDCPDVDLSLDNPYYCMDDTGCFIFDKQYSNKLALAACVINHAADTVELPDCDFVNTPLGTEYRGYALSRESIGQIYLKNVRKFVVPYYDSMNYDELFNANGEMFNGCMFNEVVIDPRVFVHGCTSVFDNTPTLRAVFMNNVDNLTGYTNSVSLETLNVPSMVKSLVVGGTPLKMQSLSSVNYNAKDCEYVHFSWNSRDGAYTSVIPKYKLTIGSDVDRIVGVHHNRQGFHEIISYADEIIFEGPNYINLYKLQSYVTTKDIGPFEGAPGALNGLIGDIYVDAQGIVYSLDDDTYDARVVYSSPGASNLVIPSTVVSEDGNVVYTVTRIETGAFMFNTDLKSVTFEDASVLEYIGSRAFDCCGKLASVTDRKTERTETSQNMVKELFVNADVSVFAFYGTGLVSEDGVCIFDTVALDTMRGAQGLAVSRDGESDLRLSVSMASETIDWVDNGDGIGGYHMLTGGSVNIVAYANNIGATDSLRYRIYMAMTNDNCEISFEPGETYYIDGHAVECHGTDDPRLLYLEFASTIGDTLSVPVTASCGNGTNGGGLRVWATMYDVDEAGLGDGDVELLEENGYLVFFWDTRPDEFNLTWTRSTDLNNMKVMLDDNGVPAFTRNVKDTMTLNRDVSESSLGKDYARCMYFNRIYEFSSGVGYAQDVINAVRNGEIYIKSDGWYLNGSKLVGGPSFLNPYEYTCVYDMPYFDENGNIVWPYRVYKIRSDVEFGSLSYFLELCPAALAFGDDAESYEDVSVKSYLNVEVEYTYSAPKEYAGMTEFSIAVNDGKLDVTKTIETDATYFGERMKYRIHLLNNRLGDYPADEGTASLVDDVPKYCYLSYDDIDEILSDPRCDRIEIGYWVRGEHYKAVSVDGTDAWLDYERMDTTVSVAPTLTVEKVEGKVVATCGSLAIESDKVEAALREIGFNKRRDNTYYKIIWSIPTISSGGTMDFYVPCTVNDVFRLLGRDEKNEYLSSGAVSLTNSCHVRQGNLDIMSTSPITRVYRNNRFDQGVYRNGELCKGGYGADTGDVLTYNIIHKHWGTDDYDNLPMSEDLYGAQMLMVPVDLNPQLGDEGFRTVEYEGVTYYIMDKPGVYKSVKVGTENGTEVYVADTVTIEVSDGYESIDMPDGTSLGFSGLHTNVLWVYDHIDGSESYVKNVQFQAFVDLSVGDENSYTLGAVAYLNNATGHRLFAPIFGGGTKIDFDKNIVQERGSVPDDDILIESKESFVSEGQDVTYRLEFMNLGDSSFTLNGSDIVDLLPDNGNAFRWSEDNVKIEAVWDDGVICVGIDTEWTVEDSHDGFTDQDSQQYIIWPSSVECKFTGCQRVYLYVTLTYPKGDEWNAYTDVIGYDSIENILTVYRYDANVVHYLKTPGEILLQKGVFGSGSSRDIVLSFDRQYYSNPSLTGTQVVYYVVLYNGGNKRFYIDDMYDQLPDGFSMYGLNADVYNILRGGMRGERMITTDPSICRAFDKTFVSDSDSDVQYKSLTLSYEVMDGNVVRIFTTKAAGTKNVCDYDSTVGKYYLNKNEAVVFGYTVEVGEHDATNDLAKNSIAMRYIETIDTGVKVQDGVKFTGCVQSAPNRMGDCNIDFSLTNDGLCNVVENDASVSWTPFEDGDIWLESDVTLYRGNISPGTQKFVKSYSDVSGDTHEYSGSVMPDSTVNWESRFFNYGKHEIIDWTIVDVMPKPYSFTGDVVFAMESVSGYKYFENHMCVPIVGRDDGGVYVRGTSGNVYCAWGTENRFINGYSMGGSVNPVYYVTFDIDSNGNEVLKIRSSDVKLAIPADSFLTMRYSSVNNSSVRNNQSYMNQVYFYPNSQEFDSVSQGVNVYENGKLVGAQSSAPVTVAFGYSTGSDKSVEGDGDIAIASDMEHNAVSLLSQSSVFRYNISVMNKSDTSITDLVLIDNLPYVGDHSAFDENVARGSEFGVNLNDNPGFEVKVGDTVLDSSQYTIEYSSETDFNDSDWDCSSTWGVLEDEARSIRVHIQDPDGVLITSKTTVTVSFDCKVDPDSVEGMTAWNSFGYRYKVKDSNVVLDALSLPVGVRIPSVPVVYKQALDGAAMNQVPVDEDKMFSFVVYEGEYVESEDIEAYLITNGVLFKRFDVIVPAGESRSQGFALAGFEFEDGKTYTVVETDAGDYIQYGFNNTVTNHYSFEYNSDTQTVITCVNKVTGPVLPDAGGIGVHLLYLFGSLVLIVTVGLVFVKKNK